MEAQGCGGGGGGVGGVGGEGEAAGWGAVGCGGGLRRWKACEVLRLGMLAWDGGVGGLLGFSGCGGWMGWILCCGGPGEGFEIAIVFAFGGGAAVIGCSVGGPGEGALARVCARWLPGCQRVGVLHSTPHRRRRNAVLPLFPLIPSLRPTPSHLNPPIPQHGLLHPPLRILIPQKESTSLLLALLARIEPSSFVWAFLLHAEVLSWQTGVAVAVPGVVFEEAAGFDLVGAACTTTSTAGTTTGASAAGASIKVAA